MLPTKWNFIFNKPTETIKWDNSAYTFQSNVSFAKPSQNYIPYYEVTVISFSVGVTIGVGAPDIKGEKILPGGKRGSYGYTCDGKLKLEANPEIEYGPTFTVGDTVGCGITSNNELFFTKNGANLGVACKLPNIKLFPIIGLDYATICSNFGKIQFLYDPILRAASPSTNAEFETAMSEVTILNILSHLSAKDVLLFGRVCRKVFQLSRTDHIWKLLVYRAWPINFDVPKPNFYQFYKKRTKQLKESKDDKPTLVENCIEWDFRCPATLDKFIRGDSEDIDFCTVCNRNVYLVQNMGELNDLAKQGECVAIDFDGTIVGERVRANRSKNHVLRGRPCF